MWVSWNWKTSVARKHNEFVDLESSLFNSIGNIPWEDVYVNVAADIVKQGKSVFVSSHPEVRSELESIHDSADFPIVVVYPSIELKNIWMDRLYVRFREDPTDKNKRAFTRVFNYYDSDINSLEWNQSSLKKLSIDRVGSYFDLYEFLMDELGRGKI